VIRLMFQRPELAPALSVFTEDVVVVGRGGAAGAAPDWVLPFADVSRLQCRFTMGGDTVFVEGLSERNATFVNNRKISAITRMHPGDVVRFGACVIRFVGTTPEGDVAAKPEPVQAPVPVPARVVPRPAPMPTPAAPRVEVGPAGAEEPVSEDMSPIREQAQRWELHGQVPELLLRGDALRRGLVWLRRGAALPAGGAVVRRFVEASARRRRQRRVGGAQACGLVLATLLGGHATASWIYPELVGPDLEPPPALGSVCDPGVLARADQIVAAAGQEVDGASALLGLGYALQVAEVGGCRVLSKAEPALRLRLAGQRARVLGQVEGPVQALVLRPDGRLAAVADAQGGLSIVDMHGQMPKMLPADASGPVAQMAWSADRRWLATGGSDSEVLLWDVDQNRISRHRALDLDGEATALAFSPDGAVLATGEKGGALRLWDIGGEASGRKLDEKKGLPGAPSQLVFDAAGMRLYGLVGSRVWVWSLTSTGEGRRFASSVQLESELSVTAMAVDLGGHRIVTGDMVGQVLLWKQAGGRWKERQLAMHDEAVVQVQIVPERDVVISTAADRSIKLVELSTRGKKGGMPFPQAMVASEAALHIVIDAAGRRMLTVGASEPPELWDLAARRLEPLARLSEQRAPVRTVALAETQALVVTGDEVGTLRAWDLMVDGGSAGAHVIGDHKTAIEAVGLSRSGSTLASAGRDGQLRVWKIDEHGTPERLAVRSPGSPLQELTLSQDGRWIAGAAKNLIYVWDTRSQDGEAHIALAAHEQDIAYLAFSTGDERLVTVDRDGVVLTWQMVAGGPVGEPSRRVELGSDVAALVVSRERVAVGTLGVGQKGRVHAWALADTVEQPPSVWEHSDSVSALVMSEDGTQLASGSQDGSVTVGEWRNGRFERTGNGYNLGVRIEALAMIAGPDGALAIGGVSGEVAVRELSRAGEPRRFKAHEGPVRGLTFVGTEHELLTAGQDGALKWWHLEGDGEPREMALTGHTGAIRELLVDAGGQIAVSMGVDQTLRVWPLTTQGLLQLACGAAGRNLTGDERERLLVDPAPLCGLQE